MYTNRMEWNGMMYLCVCDCNCIKEIILNKDLFPFDIRLQCMYDDGESIGKRSGEREQQRETAKAKRRQSRKVANE